mmetsp:Transcript_9314/g.11549  ORF Transcript_9314/g.11549 Transcript_9314/m.11549 type:complete len:98 (+) Transcript_9314:1194-1487(+)
MRGLKRPPPVICWSKIFADLLIKPVVASGVAILRSKPLMVQSKNLFTSQKYETRNPFCWFMAFLFENERNKKKRTLQQLFSSHWSIKDSFYNIVLTN